MKVKDTKVGEDKNAKSPINLNEIFWREGYLGEMV